MTDKEFIKHWRKLTNDGSRHFQRLNEALDRLEAAQPAEERDYTPEEALAEAVKRWGPKSFARIHMDQQSVEPKQEFQIGGPYMSSSLFIGKSFRAAFASADKAPQTSAERDYTPEEALAEARRRWGLEAIMNVDMDTDGKKYTGVLYWVSPGPEEEVFSGKTFRAAFAKADKASKTGGDK